MHTEMPKLAFGVHQRSLLHTDVPEGPASDNVHRPAVMLRTSREYASVMVTSFVRDPLRDGIPPVPSEIARRWAVVGLSFDE